MSNAVIEIIVSILVSAVASTGFWSYIMTKSMKKNSLNKLILGLAHDRIINLCDEYITRGYISVDEYENLKKYLFDPYSAAGGNGTAAKLMSHIDSLPVRNGE